ncbi:MAG: 3-dehydroquinate synthase [Eubacteriales bacterium]
MNNRLSVLYQRKPCYDIVFSFSFDGLKEEIINLQKANRKICIVTDSNVNKIYGNEIVELLSPISNDICVFEFLAGEESKTLDTVEQLYIKLIEHKFDRKDYLIALGGGVVGDLTGYVAATYLRGIDFIQVPTTLLSQVDSSVGGKTGVDFKQYKNMVGAFKMPSLVYTNLQTLQSLDERQYFNGFAEVMKHGLIKDANYYEWLVSNMYEICERDPITLEELVLKSCQIKKAVVEKDPHEKGDRALLNFGHTLGHAIEKYMNFTLYHGECVALGCVAAAYISFKKEYLSSDEYYEVRDMFVPFNLPITVENIDIDDVISITKLDKKVEGDFIKFILLKKIGKAFIDTTVTVDDMKLGLKEIVYLDEFDEK